VAAVLALAFIGVVPALHAQQSADSGRVYQPDALSTGAFASRTSLEEAARGTGPAADAARERLANGDFQVGDRLALLVQGEPTLSDTFTVREGQLLRLPNITDLRLHGVLHSEIQDDVTRELGKYIKNPVVRATPLVRVAVLGQVGRPGYYSAPADELVSDMLMRAGGPTTNSDLNKTVVRRGTELVYPAKTIQTAMAQGQTIDQLNLRPGDQIVVGEKPPGGNTLRIIGIVAGLAGIAVSIALIARH